MMKLEKLLPIDLREAWKNEAQDFTPWLASGEGLELLGESVNLELELDGTEKDVGPYRADIVCIDNATNTKVLIENQIEKTNHNHLGQILTYAAGLDTVTIIWIAKKFTDEHRATIDWLNEISNEKFNFFGLEIELWKIGVSGFAPKFNVVSKPNDWLKQRSINFESDGISDTRKILFDYWGSFNDYMERTGSFIRTRSPRPQHWATYSIGRSHFWLSTAVNSQGKRIGVTVSGSGPYAKGFYQQLLEQREKIENEIGIELMWKMATKQFVIRLWKTGEDPLDKSKWDTQFEWLKKHLEILHSAFSRRIKKLQTVKVNDESEEDSEQI